MQAGDTLPGQRTVEELTDHSATANIMDCVYGEADQSPAGMNAK
jgi:hypothetical protein